MHYLRASLYIVLELFRHKIDIKTTTTYDDTAARMYEFTLSPSSSSESDTTTDTDDSDQDNIADTRHIVDAIYVNINHDMDKTHAHYYIGSCYVDGGIHVMNVSVPAEVLYRHPFVHIIKYLRHYNTSMTFATPTCEIMQLFIVRGVYTVVLKTYWLRIIQRTWKKLHKIRRHVMSGRTRVRELFKYDLRGRYSAGLNWLPTIYGMLGYYRRPRGAS